MDVKENQTLTANPKPNHKHNPNPDPNPNSHPDSIKALLGKFGLSGDVVFQPVASLSGGQKVRIGLCSKPNPKPNPNPNPSPN